jgi:hypothetical protein
MLPNNQYEVLEHTWDTAPADLWPLIQDWIIRQRKGIIQ